MKTDNDSDGYFEDDELLRDTDGGDGGNSSEDRSSGGHTSLDCGNIRDSDSDSCEGGHQ